MAIKLSNGDILEELLLEYGYQRKAHRVLNSDEAKVPKPLGFLRLRDDSALDSSYCSYLLVSEFSPLAPGLTVALTVQQALDNQHFDDSQSPHKGAVGQTMSGST